MADLVRDVETFGKKSDDWVISARGSVADEVAANEVAAERARLTSSTGVFMVSEAQWLEHEDRIRRAYDAELLARGTALQIEANVLERELDAQIAAGETLPALSRQFSTGTEKWLSAKILEHLERASVLDDLATLTLPELVETYATWRDTEDISAVRLVEAAVTSGGLQRLRVRPAEDPTQQALALQQLQDAIAARRRARVPAALLAARDRLRQTRTAEFGTKLAHLDSGKGIARRPRPLVTPVF